MKRRSQRVLGLATGISTLAGCVALAVTQTAAVHAAGPNHAFPQHQTYEVGVMPSASQFSAGSIWFERHLLPGSTGSDGQIVRMVSNILRVFTRGPAGKTHPARSNLRALGIHAGYLRPFDDSDRA